MEFYEDRKFHFAKINIEAGLLIYWLATRRANRSGKSRRNFPANGYAGPRYFIRNVCAYLPPKILRVAPLWDRGGEGKEGLKTMICRASLIHRKGVYTGVEDRCGRIILSVEG